MAAPTTLHVDDSRGDRVHVILDRPGSRNAINATMVSELHVVCAELEARPRVLIISGENGVFASGADISELRERRRDDALAGINSGLFVRIARLPMPVIAAVDGWALGGGAELAYAADFRLASTAARIGNPETSLGIIAAAGGTWRLSELVGEALAMEILLAGRTLNGEEALAAGLVVSVHSPDELIAAANGLADRIARQDPLAVRLTKTLIRAPRASHPAADEAAQAVLFESDEKYRRMTEFLEKKK